jgi:Domain of Unknown Function (DUF1080)
MRYVPLVFVLLAGPSFADEKAKPNSLTPEEIAKGRILLFDGETTFGLKTEGNVKVKDGTLVVGAASTSSSIRTTTAVRSFKCEYELSADGRTWGRGFLSFAETGVLDVGHGLGAHARVPGLSVAHKDDSVEFHVKPDQTAYLRSIKLVPLRTAPLFNGVDLTGWKEFKPTKDKKVASKFTVTKEGWLNVKNGPGDLQTEGQWADFVLQFECISNGKHLNSGLFFRCIPDLYQQGYEAQIRNQWEGDDRTKPVDYGTGAIYRRQPARKVVSTDGEWFAMTVAAHGRHIATWVNGYQVTDWTDDRKESDNARNGFKKGKGALSIQGHDPTTDLSFRNIRIQSLDPK